MKCHICNYDIPAGGKYCPGCGRVLTAAELLKLGSSAARNIDNTVVYRPASTGKTKISSDDPSINNIFNKGPDTPEYRTEQAYNRATADVVEYDKKFVSRKNDKDNTYDDIYEYSVPSEKNYDEPDYAYDDYEDADNGYDIEPEYDNNNDNSEDDHNTKRSKFNIKPLIICIALIAGLAVIVTGVYQIGKQIGLWGESETQVQTDDTEEEKTLGEKAPIVKEPDSTTSSLTSGYKIGIYTVTSAQQNIVMQKSPINDTVIATVPNGTVIKITEISNEMGKATFSEYTGWLSLEELLYTPDAKLTEPETTTQAEGSSDEDANIQQETPSPDNPDENENPDNNADEPTYSPGNYTVDLQGDGTYLNVRDTSSPDGAVVTTIDEGVQVTVNKVEHGWGYITTPDGNEGWVYMIYLK